MIWHCRRSWSHLAVAAACLLLFGGADWRQFRGTNQNGVAADDAVPTTWNAEENIAWTADLTGRGLSAPIVVGQRVIVTCSSGHEQDRLHVVCMDVRDGTTVWERQLWATGRTTTHPKTCVAAPTPASDGRRIYALYSSNDLACFDLQGNLLWYRGLAYDFPNASNSLGMASSLCVIDETVIVQVENEADSFAAGLDAETGLTRWKLERPRHANWTSPVILPGASDRPADARVLLQSRDGLTVVAPRSGRIIWTYGEGASTISSSVVADDTVYVPSQGITALRPGHGAEPERLWQQHRLSPSTISPLVLNGRIYSVKQAGVLVGADVRTGKIDRQMRLKGPFSASPVAAGRYLYLINERGLAQVVRTGEQLELVSENDFGETILATPAVADGALYVRSDRHLWKIAR